MPATGQPGVQLPPHSTETERAVLACVLDAGEIGGAKQTEVDALLLQLVPDMFYDLRHKSLLSEMVKMRMAGHATDRITVYTWLNNNKRLEDVGGMAYYGEFGVVGVTLTLFGEYVDILRKLAKRRWALRHAVKISEQAQNGDLDLKDLRAEISAALDALNKGAERERPRIEVVKLSEIRNYVPDPKTWLIGADMICLGELTVIAGLPEAGKSMLGNTLAFAGAAGEGQWMGYEIRRKFRTFVLQSEGSMRRMQKETANAPADAEEWLRFSKPCHLAFGDPGFRQALRQYWEAWPFDLLIIDNWSDCVKDDKFTDYQEALDFIRASLPDGDKMPAVMVIAHLSKAVIKAEKPLTGRALMAHVSGSFRLGQKARTVFTLVRAHPELEDDDTVIFDCGKANNDTPQAASAWHRKPVRFLPYPDFDMDEWRNPPEDGGKKTITDDHMKQLLPAGRRATKRLLVGELIDQGFSQPTAYRALDNEKGKFKDFLAVDNEGLIAWRH